MHKIVFLDRDTLAPHIRLRRPAFAHDWVEHPRTAPAQLLERLADATIVITNKVPLRAELLAQLPALRLVAVAATGTDCVDKAACAAQDIAVCNIRGYSVDTVPEHVFALILALRRNLLAYREDVLAGEWQRAAQFCFFNHPIRDLRGTRLGIIGKGLLGERVAALGRAFGMEPVFAARKGCAPAEGYTAFDEVLATSSVLSLHCPLTASTRNLIGMAEFRAMSCTPLLINTARGGLVNETDLVRALDEGLISGAGFDVTDGEPPADDNPLLQAAARRNVILTPHVAWASDEAQQTLADQLIENIELFVGGTPRNLVKATD
ncbi:D-2-hydroxyacid dehydrogenase [Parazoarcus communis]|uniref:Glycerate dehydrogenase n=1 Tax=Parazoarcus communis SWub3 = DSM 12120 TaxID=1121029 RepID=A0A323V3D1_9RHOO|nr:D-2-hydroxyacid dehydrogenase [Parazoarcus communis]NMG68819.1 glycerate dehydrogenase [Parazoarcus communis SWub3 = DSM 12120]PZA17936.1 glycerate dehydrogenase [Azoarcus communis] [Parazoarcus communis SWub3 = DSM 12120]